MYCQSGRINSRTASLTQERGDESERPSGIDDIVYEKACAMAVAVYFKGILDIFHLLSAVAHRFLGLGLTMLFNARYKAKPKFLSYGSGKVRNKFASS